MEQAKKIELANKKLQQKHSFFPLKKFILKKMVFGGTFTFRISSCNRIIGFLLEY